MQDLVVHSIKKLFGERLRQVRNEREKTQEELAAFLGISRESVSKIETGKTWPHDYRIDKMVTFLDVSLEYLFDFSKLPKELREKHEP